MLWNDGPTEGIVLWWHNVFVVKKLKVKLEEEDRKFTSCVNVGCTGMWKTGQHLFKETDVLPC